MGGRRGRKIREVFGTGNVKTKRRLSRAIREGDSNQMALSSFNLFFESKKTRSNFSNAVKLMSAIAKEAVERKVVEKKASEKIASRVWTNIKSREGIETSRELDKVLVSSAAQVLRRRKRHEKK